MLSWSVMILAGCQAIVPDLKVTDDTGAGSDTGVDTDTATDTDTGPALSERDACAVSGGYWYDAADVHQETLEGFESLTPQCHETPDLDCADTVTWAMRQDGTFLSESAAAVAISDDGRETAAAPITHVFTTLRCITGLTDLILPGNRVEQVELLNNEHLEIINFYTNEVLEWVGLPRNDDVRELHFNNNRLASIDLGHFANLERLYVAYNNLTEIDLSGLPWLVYADISDNNINGDLDISQSEYLETLRVANNFITTLTLPDAPTFLSTLYAGYNPNLSELDLSGCTGLQNISISGPGVDGIDLTAAGSNLREVYAVGSDLQALDLQNNPNIEQVQVYSSEHFTELRLAEETPNLFLIYLNGTAVTALDISGADNLTTLHATGGSVRLSELDFSEKTILSNVQLWDNDFSQSPVNLTDCDAWQEIDLSNCRISDIVLPSNADLISVNLSDNDIAAIQIPPSPVTTIDLSNNRLDYSGTDTDMLTFQGCTELQTLTVNQNPNLHLRIDDIAFSPEFLADTTSRIYMDPSQWDNTSVDSTINWIYDDTESCARLRP